MACFKLCCWILVITGYCCAVDLTPHPDMTDLQCSKGNNVSFEIPCPDEFVDSVFKKFYEGEFIVSDGELRDDTKYGLDADKTHVTLKECHEDDEGIYYWLCEKSGKVRNFILDIRRQIDANLVCFKGHDISFDNPCPLPEQFEKCRFIKRLQSEFIILNGTFLDQRFELDVGKTGITLKGCTEDDGGKYFLKCGACAPEMRFYLEVQPRTD